MSGKDMVKLFKGAGWQVDRIKGSHHIMVKGNRTWSIPVHKNEDLKPGMYRACLKVLEESKDDDGTD